MTKAVIQTQNLKRCFKDTVAVHQINLEVYPGEVFGFLGHNGAGAFSSVGWPGAAPVHRGADLDAVTG